MNKTDDSGDDLLNLIARVLGMSPAELNEESSPKSVYTWDSLSMLNLVLEIEDAYCIKLEQSDLLQFSSVGKIRAIVERHTQPN